MKDLTLSQDRRLDTLIGAGFGLALFLGVALLPSVVYGGYAGLLLAGGIFGTPVEATLLPRALIAFGMVLGVVAVGSLFTVGGAVVGAAVGTLSLPAARKAPLRERAGSGVRGV